MPIAYTSCANAGHIKFVSILLWIIYYLQFVRIGGRHKGKIYTFFFIYTKMEKIDIFFAMMLSTNRLNVKAPKNKKKLNLV